MNVFAEHFDLPIDSKEHRLLRETCWMGDTLVSVPYYLGRLVRQNLFRESCDDVENALVLYLNRNGWRHGAIMVRDHQAWRPTYQLLKHQLEIEEGTKPTQNVRLIAAIDALMKNALLTDAKLAVVANTTVGQISRMSDVTVLRRVWRFRSTAGE